MGRLYAKTNALVLRKMALSLSPWSSCEKAVVFFALANLAPWGEQTCPYADF